MFGTGLGTESVQLGLSEHKLEVTGMQYRGEGLE